MKILVEATKLASMRGEQILFTNLDISLERGEIVLLRGRNGSGKTTLLRQLAGLSQPQAGRLQRYGSQHWIGHNHGLKAHETPRLHLRHWANVWGSACDIEQILARLNLKRPADVPSRLLSAGQKRRTAIGRLLLEDRPIWLLDEPFNALDTQGHDMLRDLIEAHVSAGGAVIAALHGETAMSATREISL